MRLTVAPREHMNGRTVLRQSQHARAILSLIGTIDWNAEIDCYGCREGAGYAYFDFQLHDTCSSDDEEVTNSIEKLSRVLKTEVWLSES